MGREILTSIGGPAAGKGPHGRQRWYHPPLHLLRHSMSQRLLHRVLTAAVAVTMGAGLIVGATVSSAAQPRPAAPRKPTHATTWGHNSAGGLGLGSTARALTPLPVQLPPNTTSVALGQGYSLAVAGGKVLAWGDNELGQLGDDTTRSRLRPVRVALPPSARVVAVAVDLDHSLALTSTGRVYAWGHNQYGQLGDGSTTNRNRPVRVPNRSRVIAIAAGQDHSLAVTRKGAVWAWGRNDVGQLGDGTTARRARPTQTLLPHGVRAAAVSAGTSHSVAVTRNGRVISWGPARLVGSAKTVSRPRPAPPRYVGLPDRRKVVAAAAGSRHTLALTRSGRVYAWGDNETGQLGIGSAHTRLTPQRIAVPGRPKVVSVDATSETSLLLTSSDDVWAWEANDFGQLGNGELNHRDRPQRVEALSGAQVKTIAAGHSHNPAIVTAPPHASRFPKPVKASPSPSSSPPPTTAESANPKPNAVRPKGVAPEAADPGTFTSAPSPDATGSNVRTSIGER